MLIAFDAGRSVGAAEAAEFDIDLESGVALDTVTIRRNDFEVIAEAAEELEARIRMERTGYESSRADEIRTALSRAGKGE
jgi:hypothetical protein